MSNKLILPATTAELTPVQKGWLLLCQTRIACFDDLQKNELAVQEAVKGYETMPYEKVKEVLTTAKSKAADGKAQRLHFTGMLNEKLISPSMEFEKRNDAVIALVAAKEIELRKAEVEKNEAANNHAQEVARLKAHIKNEYARIRNRYVADLIMKTDSIYIQCLKDKIAVKDLDAVIAAGVNELKAITLEKPNKFARVLVNDKQAKEAALTVERYNSAADLAAAVDNLSSKAFEMYAEDLRNADSAIAATEQKAEMQIAQNNESLEIENATNILFAAAEPLVMTGGPKVKKVKKIVVEDTEQFAMKVLAVFIKNWPEASKKLGLKSWTKLVDPFVKALDKMETTFPEFKIEEICK